MRTINAIAIMLATMSLVVVSTYARYNDDDHDYEQHQDDYNDSQESQEEPDDALDDLNVNHGHIDYYKHHNQRNKDMYKEPTHAKYIFTYEVKDRQAGQKKKKLRTKSRKRKQLKGSHPRKTTKTTEHIVHYPAYSKGGVADTSVHTIRHETNEHNDNGH